MRIVTSAEQLAREVAGSNFVRIEEIGQTSTGLKFKVITRAD